MRLRDFALAASLALPALHCSSEEAKAPPADNVVENHPGALVITSPPRAAMIEDSGQAVEVTGTGATGALTINGAPAEVAADGSFHATIKPEAGLNLIVAVDGESRLEAPFLFGHFLAAEKPVARAFTLDFGPNAINAPAPSASLTTVANGALAGRDLVGVMKGQSFNGNVLGQTWKFDVTGGKNGAANLALSPDAKALGVTATVKDVQVDGTLTLNAFGKTYANPVKITVATAVVMGAVEIGVDNGVLKAAMPTADTQLDGFAFDTNNAGFPCCVDTILSTVMRPKVEEAIRDGVKNEVPKLVKVTLDGLGIPKELDLSSIGVAQKIPLATKFDGAGFDPGGGTVSVSALFGGPLAPGSAGAKAPGWLGLGQALPVSSSRGPNLGATISLDAVNQLMFATWGTGKIAFDVPAPFDATLSPALPPVVTVGSSGALKVGLGEILVTKKGASSPMAAVTMMQDIAPSGTSDSLILTPSGEPTLSITWFSDDYAASRDVITSAAKEQLGRFLKPFKVALPKFGLDGLGAGFAGQSLAIDAPTVAVDKNAARVGMSGAMKIVK